MHTVVTEKQSLIEPKHYRQAHMSKHQKVILKSLKRYINALNRQLILRFSNKFHSLFTTEV